MNARQRRRAVRAWRRAAESYSFGRLLPVLEVSGAQLLELPNYSTTIPTGCGPGKVWCSNLVETHRHARACRGKLWVAARLPPIPSWLEAVWYRHEVTERRHPLGGNCITGQRIRVVEEPRRLFFIAGNATGKSSSQFQAFVKELPPRLAQWADPSYHGRRRLPRRSAL